MADYKNRSLEKYLHQLLIIKGDQQTSASLDDCFWIDFIIRFYIVNKRTYKNRIDLLSQVVNK